MSLLIIRLVRENTNFNLLFSRADRQGGGFLVNYKNRSLQTSQQLMREYANCVLRVNFLIQPLLTAPKNENIM